MREATDVVRHALLQVDIGSYGFTLLVHAQQYLENDFVAPKSLVSRCKVCGWSTWARKDPEPLCKRCSAWVGIYVSGMTYRRHIMRPKINPLTR